MKTSIILLSAILVSGCVNGYNPRYYYNEVLVVNLAGDVIEDVKIRILDTPKSLSCDAVRKNAMCQDYFPRRYYPQQGIELNWRHVDGSSKAETFSPSVPVTYSSAFPLRIVVEVREDGTIKPFYEQDEPSRDGGMFISG